MGQKEYQPLFVDLWFRGKDRTEPAHMQEGPQINQIIADIRETVRLGNWEQYLWSFLSSREMKSIVQQLIDVKKEGQWFVPGIPDALHPYMLCKSHLTRCIVITSLKSNAVETAGRNKAPMQPTTAVIRAVLGTVADEAPEPMQWCRDGVLQISTAMTSTLNGDHHYDIWAPWTAYVVSKVNELYPTIPWVIVGKDAQKYWHLIRSPYKYIVQTWPDVRSNDAWEKANHILEIQGKRQIQWDNHVHRETKKEKWLATQQNQ